MALSIWLSFLNMFRAYFDTCKIKPKPTHETGAQATKPTLVSHKYDNLFARHAGVLPVSYLRALAKRESNLNPGQTEGSYWGILQVGWRKGSVMDGYNRRFKTRYTRKDLLDPETNIKIASELLNRIARTYEKSFPGAPNMQIDFDNPEFVKLLTAGWNSGYSKAAGVQKVAAWLQKNNIPITHDNVFKYAHRAGGTKFLRGETYDHARRKRLWQRGVASLFYKLRDEDPPTDRPQKPGVVMPLLALLALPLGIKVIYG